MRKRSKMNLLSERELQVVKANALIQKSRYNLSVQEQKIILRVIQKIKPTDTDFQTYHFDLNEFCEFLGINSNGKNYQDLKQALLKLSKEKWWLTRPNGSIATVGWISKAIIEPGTGEVIIKLDEDLKPYLLQLKNYFTQYSLYYTLAMRSKYSIRMYELLKSYENLGKIEIDLEQLKNQLMCEYDRWQDFRRYVLEQATKEINLLSDLFISCEPVKTGRKITSVMFTVSPKTNYRDRLDTWAEIENRLDNKQIKGQMNLAMLEVLPNEPD